MCRFISFSRTEMEIKVYKIILKIRLKQTLIFVESPYVENARIKISSLFVTA